MEKREQVFVSSTYTDLREAREVVIQALLEGDCFPAGMEMFPASDAEKWELIKGVIDDSDYYLLIIGGRYGSEDDVTQLSYTEMEYDYAVEKQKPVMAFVHGEPDSIASGRTDKDDKKRAKLESFRAKVEKKMVKHWTKGEELPGYVAQALFKIRKSHPAIGWVRGDYAMTPEVREELIALRTQAALESVKVTAPVFHDLDDSEDEIEFEADIGLTIVEDPEVGDDAAEKVFAGRVESSVTWNALFALVAPTLLHETSEVAYTRVLESALEQVTQDSRSGLEGFPDKVTYWKTEVQSVLELRDDTLVQFLALRLIERGTQKRPVNDSSRYWKLTERGEDRMMQLRARRKSTRPNDG